MELALYLFGIVSIVSIIVIAVTLIYDRKHALRRQTKTNH